jgi:hypothetical protein
MSFNFISQGKRSHWNEFKQKGEKIRPYRGKGGGQRRWGSVQANTCPPMFTAALLTTTELWTELKHPLKDGFLKKVAQPCRGIFLRRKKEHTTNTVLFLETGSWYVKEAGLKLRIPLPQPPDYWDYRCAPPPMPGRMWLYFYEVFRVGKFIETEKSVVARGWGEKRMGSDCLAYRDCMEGWKLLKWWEVFI